LYSGFSNSTWNRHTAALNSFKKFYNIEFKKLTWPIDAGQINAYCNWALTKEKLSPSTVKAYILSIQSLHRLKGYENYIGWNYICKTLVRAAENEKEHCKNRFTRTAMNLPTLKLLGHGISKQNWSPHTKQVIWTACTVAFFGSFRMGELLAEHENYFDRNSTLLWGDIKKFKDEIIVHIKRPKSRNPKGEIVDLFPFPGHNCCPVKALEYLALLSKKAKLENKPVFMFENGKLLTKNSFNSTIKQILSLTLGKNSCYIYGHSFRAAIPSLLAKHPEISNRRDILGWGRWCSEAYNLYTRLQYDQKLNMYSKIVYVLNSSV